MTQLADALDRLQVAKKELDKLRPYSSDLVHVANKVSEAVSAIAKARDDIQKELDYLRSQVTSICPDI